MSCEVYFDLYKDIVFAIITSDHLYHQESLLKITHTLTMKNEEISNFVCTLKQSLDNLEVKWQIYLWTSVVCLFAFFSIQCRCFFYLLSLFFFFYLPPGKLHPSAGRPAGWVHDPSVSSWWNEGQHVDAYQTGESHPHIWAPGTDHISHSYPLLVKHTAYIEVCGSFDVKSKL